MRPRNENTKNAERQMKYLVYHLEMASRMADEAGEASGLCLLNRLWMWLSSQPLHVGTSELWYLRNDAVPTLDPQQAEGAAIRRAPCCHHG